MDALKIGHVVGVEGDTVEVQISISDLRIQAFYGTSANAVKTQVWIAVSAYLLVALVKKRLNLSPSLYEILQILSVTLFEKTPVLQAFSAGASPNDQDGFQKQLSLFEL